MNFHLEGLDELQGFGEEMFGGVLPAIGVLAIFFIILTGIAVICLWVFSSIGLMNLAKKNNIEHAWLSFLPVGRSYIIGKLGFETYGDINNSNNQTFMWITLGLGAAAFLLSDSTGDVHKLINYGLLFFECWAFYNMFKNLKPSKTVVYTVFTALTGTLLGGLFLYLLKPEEVKQENNTEEKESKDNKEKTSEEKTKKETKKIEEKVKSNFCDNCGTKINRSAKFCQECGKELK